jgi:hypothetical protein
MFVDRDENRPFQEETVKLVYPFRTRRHRSVCVLDGGKTRDEYLRAALLGVCELPAAEEPVRECVVDELRSRSKVQLAHGAGSVHFGRLRHRRPRSSAFCPTKPEICGLHEIVILSTKFSGTVR